MKRRKPKAIAIKKRLRKMQRKARFAGFLYFLGSIALLACLVAIPFLMPGYATGVTVLSFYQPIIDVTSQPLTLDLLLGAIVGGFYLLMLLTAVINFFRSFSRLSILMKSHLKYKSNVDYNYYAMQDLGDYFSKTFTAIIVYTVLIFLFQGQPKLLDMAFLITVVAGVAFHLLAGLAGGNIAVFFAGERLVEQPREGALAIFFIRNLLQIGATLAMVYFFALESTFGQEAIQLLDTLVIQKAGMGDIMGYIPLAIEFLIWICMFVLIGRANSTIEFHHDGMETPGIKRNRVFTFFTVLLVVALHVVPVILNNLAFALNQNLAIVAGVALVSFILDCIIHPKERSDFDNDGINYGDPDLDMYFNQGNANHYHNTII